MCVFDCSYEERAAAAATLALVFPTESSRFASYSYDDNHYHYHWQEQVFKLATIKDTAMRMIDGRDGLTMYRLHMPPCLLLYRVTRRLQKSKVI